MTSEQHCKSCRHWDRIKDGEYGAVPGTGECTAVVPVWVACEVGEDGEGRLRPGYAGLLSMVADGSGYKAELITMPEFGCVRHEPR